MGQARIDFHRLCLGTIEKSPVLNIFFSAKWRQGLSCRGGMAPIAAVTSDVSRLKGEVRVGAMTSSFCYYYAFKTF